MELLETSFEHLENESFSVSLLSVKADKEIGAWESQLTLSRTDYDVEFSPASFDLLGEDAQISEKTYSLNANATRPLRDALSLDLGIGYRDGFSNYRSVWLDTYFDQHFEPLVGVPGHELYQNFSASAASLSGGLTWEYIPANAVASVTASWIQDNVSPGYEIDFEGISRGERVLATNSLSITSENVLNPRMRSRIALTASQTSARDTRYSADLALNSALGEKFIWRNRIGLSKEAPQFEAYFLDTTLEYAFSQLVSVAVAGRRYKDTGEIEDALLFTTAAPELRSDSMRLELRWVGENWNGRLSLTHTESNFAPTNLNTDFFQNLYFDSDWTGLKLAFGRSF